MGEWKKYDDLTDFDNSKEDVTDSKSSNYWLAFTGTFPEERDDEMDKQWPGSVSANSRPYWSEVKGDELRDFIRALSDAAERLYPRYDYSWNEGQDEFDWLRSAFPCIESLAAQLFGPKKAYKELYPVDELAKRVTDAIRENLHKHDYKEDWDAVTAEKLVGAWYALFYFCYIWPQREVKDVLFAMEKYMSGRQDVIDFCGQKENSDGRQEKV